MTVDPDHHLQGLTLRIFEDRYLQVRVELDGPHLSMNREIRLTEALLSLSTVTEILENTPHLALAAHAPMAIRMVGLKQVGMLKDYRSLQQCKRMQRS